MAKVGYKQPPVEYQFKKGKSGNANGRPKGVPNLATAFREAMMEKVEIIENGRRKKITKFEAATKQLVNKAASGDARAMKQLIVIMPALEQASATHDVPESTVGLADQEVLKTLAARFNKTAANAATQEDD